MDKLYEFINNSLSDGINLSEIKKNVPDYFTLDVVDYCKEQARFIPNTYNRIKLHKYSNESFEMILICWDTNAQTKIHDHPENGCVLYLIEGNLEEKLYGHKLELVTKSIYNERSVSYMDNKIGYHQILSIGKSMSLHIYSPPNHIIKNFPNPS
jgi:hypothetical protein